MECPSTFPPHGLPRGVILVGAGSSIIFAWWGVISLDFLLMRIPMWGTWSFTLVRSLLPSPCTMVLSPLGTVKDVNSVSYSSHLLGTFLIGFVMRRSNSLSSMRGLNVYGFYGRNCTALTEEGPNKKLRLEEPEYTETKAYAWSSRQWSSTGTGWWVDGICSRDCRLWLKCCPTPLSYLLLLKAFIASEDFLCRSIYNLESWIRLRLSP